MSDPKTPEVIDKSLQFGTVRRVGQVKGIESDGSVSICPDFWLDEEAGTHALIPWSQWERVVGALEMVDGVMCNFPEWWYENELDKTVKRALEDVGGE